MRRTVIDNEVRGLTIFIALMGVAVSSVACIFVWCLLLGPLAVIVLIGGLVARSRAAMIVGGVMMSGPLLYVSLALAQ